MGTPDFAVPSLDALNRAGMDITAVVTVADKPAGRGQYMTASAIKMRALTLGIPVLQPDDLRDAAFIRHLQDLAADIFVVVAFRILPPEVFTLPRLGTVNVHASLLPKYRGAAPIQWAIIAGEQETGVTTFLIEEKVDTGQWLLQRPVLISPEMTGGELHDILAQTGAAALLETVTGLMSGKLQPKAQQGQPTRAPKLTRELAHISWRQPAQRVYDHIRALSPYPGAYALLRDNPLKILRAKRIERQNGKGDIPGTVVRIEKSGEILVATEDEALAVLEVQPEGRRLMTSGEFLRGHGLSVGDRFH